jgi:hypothetical protein
MQDMTPPLPVPSVAEDFDIVVQFAEECLVQWPLSADTDPAVFDIVAQFVEGCLERWPLHAEAARVRRALARLRADGWGT